MWTAGRLLARASLRAVRCHRFVHFSATSAGTAPPPPPAEGQGLPTVAVGAPVGPLSCRAAPCRTAADAFHRHASVVLARVAPVGGTSAIVLGEALQKAAEEEVRLAFGDGSDGCEERAECSRQLVREAEEAVAMATGLAETRRELADLRRARADKLAVGFQTAGKENQEYCALVVAAAAGIFGVSVHYGFLSIFAVAFLIYRRATSVVRKQRAAMDELQDILDRIPDLEQAEAQRLEVLRARAALWSGGAAE